MKNIAIVAETDEEIMNFIKEIGGHLCSFRLIKVNDNFVKMITDYNEVLSIKKIQEYTSNNHLIPSNTSLVILLVNLGDSFKKLARQEIHNVYSRTTGQPEIVLYGIGLSYWIDTKHEELIKKNYEELTELRSAYKLKSTGLIDIDNCYDIVKKLFD